ncbi:MAG TPA: response regulator [Bryobacteraceae bacterium]|jgi:CheY-like chemotaxis protein
MLIEQILVLVVENDEVNAQVARAMLERLGCRVDTAEDGVEAIELLAKTSYHLIFMAWQMPRMDGLETTARIRSLPHGRVLPIVGTSARIGRMECLAAGMNDLMPKPFRLDKLKVELSKWTRWKEDLQTGAGR